MWTTLVRTWTSWMAAKRGDRPTRAWDLRRDETLRLAPGPGGLVLRAERGSLVVTQEGDPDDHVLGPGDELALRARGLAVVWALSAACLAVDGVRSAAGIAPAPVGGYGSSAAALAPPPTADPAA
jgi:hypothetical protein